MERPQDVKTLYFKDTSFASLMTQRIFNILLVASKYDAFSLEEDGRIDEQIFNEYTALNLRNAPRFTLASTIDEARQLHGSRNFELVIMMPTGDNDEMFDLAHEFKSECPQVPIVLLSPFSGDMLKRVFGRDQFEDIDYVFSWLGETDLLLAIVKLLEDKMNMEQDIESVGVQIVLLVEDSVHFYSAILPLLYKHVFVQSRSFMTEALNDHERMLRMRGRPNSTLAAQETQFHPLRLWSILTKTAVMSLRQAHFSCGLIPMTA